MKQSKAIKVPMPHLVLASVAVLVSNAELLVSVWRYPARVVVLVSGGGAPCVCGGADSECGVPICPGGAGTKQAIDAP
ncbi:MAG: hypothetical protein IPI39_26395 [Candidatus Obscuribacter sp.]|nr:hypothetical protein [Candidatus Obscuribacter sp.]